MWHQYSKATTGNYPNGDEGMFFDITTIESFSLHGSHGLDTYFDVILEGETQTSLEVRVNAREVLTHNDFQAAVLKKTGRIFRHKPSDRGARDERREAWLDLLNSRLPDHVERSKSWPGR